MLLPSFLELHSIAMLEAMSMRIPVVTSADVGCHDDFITSWRNGVLLDPFSDQGWADAIVRLLQNDELRKQIGQRGYDAVMEHCNIRDVARRFEALYDEVIAGKQGPDDARTLTVDAYRGRI
jgi:glycosyltransferase involved in cell wall biosynthesis